MRHNRAEMAIAARRMVDEVEKLAGTADVRAAVAFAAFSLGNSRLTASFASDTVVKGAAGSRADGSL